MFVRRLNNILKKYEFVKVWCTFNGEFVKQSVNGEEIKDQKHLQTKNNVISRDANLNQWYDEFVKDKLLKELEEFQVRTK